jgi:hypothetical protein
MIPVPVLAQFGEDDSCAVPVLAKENEMAFPQEELLPVSPLSDEEGDVLTFGRRSRVDGLLDRTVIATAILGDNQEGFSLRATRA